MFDKYLLFECCLLNLSISNLYLDVLDYLICLFLALAEKSKMVENLKTELENLYTVSQELNQRKARQEKELDNLEQEIKLTKQGIVKYRVNTYLLPAWIHNTYVTEYPGKVNTAFETLDMNKRHHKTRSYVVQINPAIVQ